LALPGPVGFDQPILDYVRREIGRGVQRGLYRVSEIAYNAAMRELEALDARAPSFSTYLQATRAGPTV